MNKNLIQDFRMSSIDERLPILGDWLEKTLLEFVKRNGVDNLSFLSSANKQAQQFTNRAITRQDDPVIDWCLPVEWFRSMFAQCIKGVDDKSLKRVYKQLGWSYKKAINPKSGDGSTLQGFDFSSIVEGANNILIKLISREKFPVDTVLVNNKSGSEWVIVGCNNNKYEITNDYGLTLFRSEIMVFKNYTVA